MADKEFTQICKEILGLSKRLEGIEPAELRKIKSDIEKINEAIAADKASFETKKKDFDGKYSGITEIINTFDELKSQIERVLKSGVINDELETSVSTFSSKKITELLNKAKSVVDEEFVKLSKSGIIAWNTTLEYPVDAVTVFNGKLYRAKRRNTGEKPSENQDIWEAIAGEKWSEKTFQKLTDAIDAYSKTESDERYLEKTADSSFIEKADFNAYTNEEPLPAGDMNSKEYWVKIKPGLYWFNSDTGGYVNKPVRYGHVLVLRHPQSSDLQVLCFEHPSHRAFHFWANGAESGGWEYINKSLGVGQEYKDVKNERRVNETYENTTDGPIFVCVSSGSMSGSCVAQFKMNGEVFATKVGNRDEGVFFSVPVPPGASYSVNLSGAAIAQWFELR